MSIRRLSVSRRQAGLTVLELTVAMSIGAIILFALFALWDVGFTAFESAEAQTRVNQELRKAIQMIVPDVAESAAAKILDVPADGSWYYSLTFHRPEDISGGEITWSPDAITYAVGGLNASQLIRTAGTEQRVVATNILSFRARRFPDRPDAIEIVVLGRQTSRTAPQVDGQLSVTVKTRN
jgi:hypothetical protein